MNLYCALDIRKRLRTLSAMNPTDEITRINQTEVPASPRAAHTPGPWYLNPRGWVVQSTGDIVTRIECSYTNEARSARAAIAKAKGGAQ